MNPSLPTISLCMIVKNEEDLLPQCLKSVKEYADEIIVVDTGSTDKTVQIAEEFGAKIFHHPWEDDFSKHRNQSIDYATGDWFLVLDADEEIVDGCGGFIRKAARETTCDSVSFLFLSLYAGSKQGMHTQERLFRNHKGIHYEGRIHNRIVGVKKTCLYPVKILHHGYNVPEDKAKQKHERRMRILNLEVAEHGENPLLHHYLAVSYLSVPDYLRAADEAVKALELARDRREEKISFYAWTHYVAATARYHSGDLGSATRFCNRGLELFPEDPDLHFVACEMAFAQKDDDLLRAHASQYLSLQARLSAMPAAGRNVHCITFDQSWRIWWFLAMSHLRQRRLGDFRKCFRAAMNAALSKSQVNHATGQYFMERGDLKRAKKELDRGFRRNPDDGDILFSEIELFIRLKDEREEIRWWVELLRRFPENRSRAIREIHKAQQEKRSVDALKLLKAVLEIGPHDWEALSLMVRSLRGQQRIDEDLRYLNGLLVAQEEHASLVEEAGYLLLCKGQAEEARPFFDKASSFNPERPSLHLGLAVIHWQQGDAEGCACSLDRALELLGIPCDMTISTQEELGTLFALAGEEFLARGSWEPATAALRTALDLNWHQASVYENLGVALLNSGQLKASIDSLKTGLTKTSPGPTPPQ